MSDPTLAKLRRANANRRIVESRDRRRAARYNRIPMLVPTDSLPNSGQDRRDSPGPSYWEAY